MENKTTNSPRHKRPGKDTKNRGIAYKVDAFSSIASQVAVTESGYDIAQAIVPIEHITRKEVKRMLSISSDVTVLTMEKNGQLSPYRIGKRVLYKAAEVEDALQSFERK